MSLEGIAKHTLEIIERGGYEASDGRFVDLRASIDAAVEGSRVYTPDELAGLLEAAPAPASASPTRIEVTAETTQAATRRLVHDEGHERVALLNFASAKNAGGGFINGAKAQEEDIARCSALHPCLLRAPIYYTSNRAHTSLAYTDHMIWSPRVPFFRVRNRELVDAPYLASVVTAPAPNAGAMRNAGEPLDELEPSLRRRAGMVLALAEAQGMTTLVLGAWGCGVFRNDPAMVADAFATWLEGPRFGSSFEQVSFAVYDRKGLTRAAFEDRLRVDARC